MIPTLQCCSYLVSHSSLYTGAHSLNSLSCNTVTGNFRHLWHSISRAWRRKYLRCGEKKYLRCGEWKYFIEMFVSTYRLCKGCLECQLLREHQHSSTKQNKNWKCFSRFWWIVVLNILTCAFSLILFFEVKCPEFCKMIFVTGFVSMH